MSKGLHTEDTVNAEHFLSRSRICVCAWQCRCVTQIFQWQNVETSINLSSFYLPQCPGHRLCMPWLRQPLQLCGFVPHLWLLRQVSTAVNHGPVLAFTPRAQRPRKWLKSVSLYINTATCIQKTCVLLWNHIFQLKKSNQARKDMPVLGSRTLLHTS